MAGCQKPSRLELALEAQATQMAALNNRLDQSEQQWQLTANEAFQLNQTVINSLETYRQEQENLRHSIQAMDEHWTVENEFVRNRQKQFQYSLSEVKESVEATDKRVQYVNQDFNTKIDTTRKSLSQDLSQVNRSVTINNEKIAVLHARANELATDANAVQQHLQKLLVSGNTVIGEHLDTLAHNQQGLQETLDQTQTTTGLTLDQVLDVNTKQDRLLKWSQTHSEHTQKSDQDAMARHLALQKEMKQLTQLDGHLQELTAQHDESTQQANKQAKQIGEQQACLMDITQKNNKKLDTIEQKENGLGNQIAQLAQGQENLQAETGTHFSDLMTTQAQLAQIMGNQSNMVNSLHQIQQQEHRQLNDQIKTIGKSTQKLCQQSQTSNQILKERADTISSQLQDLKKTQQEQNPQDRLQQIYQQNQALEKKLTQTADHQEQTFDTAYTRYQQMMQGQTQELKQELGVLTQLINRLDKRMLQVSSDLDTKMQGHSQQEAQNVQSLRQDLQQLRKGLQHINDLQSKLNQALEQLDQSVHSHPQDSNKKSQTTNKKQAALPAPSQN